MLRGKRATGGGEGVVAETVDRQSGDQDNGDHVARHEKAIVTAVFSWNGYGGSCDCGVGTHLLETCSSVVTEKSFVVRKAMGVSPALAWRLHLDDGHDREPVGLFQVVKRIWRECHFRLQGLETDVLQGVRNSGHNLRDRAGFRVNPSCAGEF